MTHGSMNMRLFCNSFADCCRLAKIHWTLMNKIKGPQLFSLYATHVWEEFDINVTTHTTTNSQHKFTQTSQIGQSGCLKGLESFRSMICQGKSSWTSKSSTAISWSDCQSKVHMTVSLPSNVCIQRVINNYQKLYFWPQFRTKKHSLM